MPIKVYMQVFMEPNLKEVCLSANQNLTEKRLMMVREENDANI